MPLLTIQMNGEDRRFDIPTGKPLFIGRAKECDINLMSPGVSRRHAVIVARGGICGIKDLDSFNGTFLNGTAVTKPATLRDGDVIRISSFTIVFSLKPSEAGGGAPDSPSGDAPSSVRLRLPRAMTDTTTIRHMMEKIEPGKRDRREGEDTCVMPPPDAISGTIPESPKDENEKK